METPNLGAIINTTDYRLHSSIAKNRQYLQNSIKALEEKIMSGVNQLQTTSAGTLLGPKVNLKQAQKVHTKLATLFDQTYGEGVRTVVQGYDQSAEYVLDMYSDLNESMKFTSFDNDMIGALKQQDMAQFLAYGAAAQEQITQALYNHIAGGASMAQLRGVIAGHLLGSVDARGRSMATYATQFANDSVMNFHNSVTLRKGEDAGFTHFLYYGNIMLTTREFCARRAMRVYSKEEIQSWTFDWAGKSGPAITNRGGYNCRHHWQPVRPEWVPEGSLPVNQYPDSEDRYAMSPEEGYLKKQLNQLRYNIKTGKKVTLDTPLVADMWFHMHPQERQNLFSKWYKAGVFDDNKDAAKVLSLDSVPGKAPPLSKAPPLKQSGVMLTESPNPKFPKPKMTLDVDELTEADIVPTPAMKPKPPKKMPPKTPTPTPAATEGSTNGKSWNDLDAKEKKVFGNYGYKMKEGKFKYHPTFATVWESLSAEAQNAKVAAWKKLGYSIPDDLPLKSKGAMPTFIQSEEVSIPKPPKSTAAFKPPKVKVTAADPDWTMDAYGLAEEQFEKSIGIAAEFTGFGEIKGPAVVNNTGAHLWGVMNDHPKLKKIVKSSPEKAHVTFMNAATTNGKSTLGSFSDQTYKMKLAASLDRSWKHELNLNKGAFSVGGDYFSTVRHEYGHYIDKVLRETTNHQDEWRKIYKSFTKKQWKTIFGEYSSMDKYEGFAEAFSAFTSPLYKPGMMPAKVENYLKKILGDNRMFDDVLEEAAAKKVKKKFKEATHEAAYNRYYREFMKQDVTEDFAKRYLRSNAPNVMNALDSWQGTTQTKYPMALKLKCTKMFADPDIAFFGSANSGMTPGKLASYLESISDEEVIKVRALTQAYYAQQKKKFVTIKRGTDGNNTGPKFRNIVNDAKAKTPKKDWAKTYVEISEPTLNGWTTSQSTASNFSGNGILVDTKVPVEDIFLPDNLWPKRSYKREKEFIVIRRKNQKYLLSDIRSNFESSGYLVQASSSMEHIIEDGDMFLATDTWLASKDVDLSELAKEEILDMIQKKIDGLKELTTTTKVKVGMSDLGEGGVPSTMVYLKPGTANKWSKHLKGLKKQIAKSSYDENTVFDFFNPDPWGE
jgi:hypothetical protein